jgi:hypothetical protein
VTGPSPWADPATPTEPGPPYAGPPVTGPPAPAPYLPAGYGPAPYGWTPYGQPPGWAPYGGPAVGPYGPWTPGPAPGPRRPGQVVGSAVLAFVQAALVLFSSLYVWMAISLVGFAADQTAGATPSSTAVDLVAEGRTLLVVGLLSTVLLLVGGVAALIRRSRTAWVLVVAAHAVQVLLAAYWGIRLYSVVGDIPGQVSEGAFAAFAIVFAIAPLVGLGLVVLGPGRRWFDGTART